MGRCQRKTRSTSETEPSRYGLAVRGSELLARSGNQAEIRRLCLRGVASESRRPQDDLGTHRLGAEPGPGEGGQARVYTQPPPRLLHSRET